MALTRQELESKLWQAADILRGQIDAADYKNYIFSALFLKRLSDRFDEEVEAADLLREYKAKIEALERLVGRQALEIEFLKGAKKNEARRKNAPTFAVAGPAACPSPEDVT